MSQIFSDRFTYLNPDLQLALVTAPPTDTQLLQMSPQFADMFAMVIRHSVLLKKKTPTEVYYAITEHADPQIGLVLAAARDYSGIRRLFPDIKTVKSLMFDENATYFSTENNIFCEGVKRVSAALAASVLIGQLSQIKEQFDHSIALEKQALSDLDRIIKVPDLSKVLDQEQATKEELVSFFFEEKTIEDGTLLAEVYIPSNSTTSWHTVGYYTNVYTTGQIIGDIADTINFLTLLEGQANIIAAPRLSSQFLNLHCIEFAARHKSADISTEVVSIRFTHLRPPSDEPQAIPFSWGIDSLTLRPESINSAIIAVQNGKLSTATIYAEKEVQPKVLYFKRAPINKDNQVLDYQGNVVADFDWQANPNFTFRVSPTPSEPITIQLPRLLAEASTSSTSQTLEEQQLQLDNDRPSQLALALLNQLYSNRADTRVLAALVRNDVRINSNSLVAVELVGFSILTPEIWMVLDILEVPPDILIAVGNLAGPNTPFSNRPRSIRIESRYSFNISAKANQGISGTTGNPRLVEMAESKLASRFKQYNPFDPNNPYNSRKYSNTLPPRLN